MPIKGNRTYMVGLGFIMAGLAPAFQNATAEPPFLAIAEIDVELIGQGFGLIFLRSGVKSLQEKRS